MPSALNDLLAGSIGTDGRFLGVGPDRLPIGGADGDPRKARYQLRDGTVFRFYVPAIGDFVTRQQLSDFVDAFEAGATQRMPKPGDPGAPDRVWHYVQMLAAQVNSLQRLLDAALIGRHHSFYAGNLAISATNQNGVGVSENHVGNHLVDPPVNGAHAAGLDVTQAATVRGQRVKLNRPAFRVRRSLQGNVSASLPVVRAEKISRGPGPVDTGDWFAASGREFRATDRGSVLLRAQPAGDLDPQLKRKNSGYFVSKPADGTESQPWFHGDDGVNYRLAEFGTGGGGGGTADLTHHSYPFGIRSEVAQADPSSPLFGDRETLLHYPGWTVSRNSGIPQGTFGFYAFDFAEELDATSALRTSYCEVLANVEEGQPVVLDIRMQIPEGFTGWGANGLVLRHRMFSGVGAGDPLDTARIDLDVFDPTTAGDTVAENVNRSKPSDVADDAGYVDLQLTQAQLNGITNPHQAGDMIHIRIKCFGLFGFGGNAQPVFRLGRLTAHLEGTGGGGGGGDPTLSQLPPVTQQYERQHTGTYVLGSLTDYSRRVPTVAGVVQFTEVYLEAGTTIATMHYFQERRGNAARNVRFGLYSSTTPAAKGGAPVTRLAETPVVNTNGLNGTFVAGVLGFTVLTDGYYFRAFIADNSILRSLGTSDPVAAGAWPVFTESSAGTTLPAAATPVTQRARVLYVAALE